MKLDPVKIQCLAQSLHSIENDLKCVSHSMNKETSFTIEMGFRHIQLQKELDPDSWEKIHVLIDEILRVKHVGLTQELKDQLKKRIN